MAVLVAVYMGKMRSLSPSPAQTMASLHIAALVVLDSLLSHADTRFRISRTYPATTNFSVWVLAQRFCNDQARLFPQYYDDLSFRIQSVTTTVRSQASYDAEEDSIRRFVCSSPRCCTIEFVVFHPSCRKDVTIRIELRNGLLTLTCNLNSSGTLSHTIPHQYASTLQGVEFLKRSIAQIVARAISCEDV